MGKSVDRPIFACPALSGSKRLARRVPKRLPVGAAGDQRRGTSSVVARCDRVRELAPDVGR
jgi:hypothetical protein